MFQMIFPNSMTNQFPNHLKVDFTRRKSYESALNIRHFMEIIIRNFSANIILSKIGLLSKYFKKYYVHSK